MGSISIPFRTSGDLWSKAIAEVGDKLPSEIFANPENKSLPELWENTESSRQRLEDKSWSFKRKNGETVYVRELLAKASKWINHFKDIGDIVVQYDPVHAALPWAGVRFLLTVATGDLDTYKSLLDRTVGIMEIICRSAVVESLLGDNQHEAAESLRVDLIKLYTSILTYLAKANSYYKQSRLKNFLKNGLLASSDFESAFEVIGEAQADVDRSVTVLELQVQMEANVKLQELIQSFDAPINRWDQALHEIMDHMHGSGKSKLASIVIEDAIEAFKRKEATYPAYFYCSRNNTAESERSDPAQVFASIARQLSTPQRGGPILEPTRKEYEEQKKLGFMSGSLGLGKSKKLVLQLLEQYPSATIVVDALDECNPETRQNLLKALESLLKESSCLLKVFVTSRTDQDITYKLSNYPNLHLSSERNTGDINLFIRSETSRLIADGDLLRDSNRKNDLGDLIIRTLISKAQGMFRLASMQLQDLRRQGTDRAIEERLNHLPKTLEESYRETLTNIENMDAIADRQYARNAISWLLCARQQLQSDEFLSLVSVIEDGSSYPISKGQLLQICSHFVMFDNATNTFRFSHLTVREFLENQDPFTSTSANALAAEVCLSKLVAPQISIKGPVQQYPFLFWAEHVREASQQRYMRLEEMLRQFLQSEEADSLFYRWHRTTEELLGRLQTLRVLDLHVRTRLEAALSYIPRVLFVVCAYDLVDVLSREQWARLVQQQYKNKAGETHQEITLRYGNGQILEWQSRGDSSFEVTEEFIEIAARNRVYGETVIARLLSNRTGAAIEITEKMVKAAVRNRISGESIMALLLESDAIGCVITQGNVDAIVGNFSPSIFQRLCVKAESGISIKEGIIRAAVANHQHSKEITAMLLDRIQEKVDITEETVIATTHTQYGKEIMALFFDHPKVRISITEDVLKAAVKDGKIDEELWTFLLNKRGSEVPITEEIVILAARNYMKCNMLITRLLDACVTVIPTTSTVIDGIVWHLNKPTVEMFLNTTGVDLLITKSLVEYKSIHSRSSDEVMEFILEKGTTRDETMDEVINAIARRSDPATLQKFLTRSGIELHMEEDVVEAAAGNWYYGCEMITFFLERYGEVPVTEQAIRSTLANGGSGHLIVARLVEKSANTIPMAERVISMIARHLSGPVFRQLLNQRASDIPITASVIEAIASGSRNAEEEWSILFENGILRPDSVGEVIGSIIATSEKSILQLFIDQKGVEIQVTEEIVHAAKRNWRNGNDMMMFILENRDRRAPITRKAIHLIATAFDTAILQQSLDGGGIDILTPQELLLAAAGNIDHGKELICFLLEEYTEDISVTEEVVEAAAGNWRSGQDILALLLDRRNGMIPVTEEALCSIIHRPWDRAETLVLILERSRTETSITEDVLRQAAKTRSPGVETLRLLPDRQGTLHALAPRQRRVRDPYD
ncbi:hypothetical protein HG530_008273 [Fusarium avenaceum]|nr:hypothetical protein HG530_008273 [Fusarium avenaceum]